MSICMWLWYPVYLFLKRSQSMFNHSSLFANAVGSKNTEAGVYKSEAFINARVNKSDPFI